MILSHPKPMIPHPTSDPTEPLSAEDDDETVARDDAIELMINDLLVKLLINSLLLEPLQFWRQRLFSLSLTEIWRCWCPTFCTVTVKLQVLQMRSRHMMQGNTANRSEDRININLVTIRKWRHSSPHAFITRETLVSVCVYQQREASRWVNRSRGFRWFVGKSSTKVLVPQNSIVGSRPLYL